uniref:Uncharacterized protein n=1 Tax=viral metagenome TaxID=1070528 RepID=A0A6H1ZD46_9ZZZZ
MRIWKNKNQLWLEPTEPDYMNYKRSAEDIAYIEEVLGLKKDGDSIRLIRKDHPEDPGFIIRLVTEP